MKKSVTKLNAVIGYPLSHTQSPMLHNPVYKMLGIDALLLPFPSPDIRALVKAIRTLPVHLTAVTMPHKQSIIPLLDHVDAPAKAVGAVNTVVNKSGKLSGYNTDIDGIRYALRTVKLKGTYVALIGAGGAASAVAYVVHEKGGKLLYLNRTVRKATDLSRKFGGEVLNGAKGIERAGVIINATPIGMHPRTRELPISADAIRKGQTVFDLVYNPVDTKLLRVAGRKGAKTVSGLDMFAVQGLRQMELWTGKKIITKRLVDRVKRNILK